MWLLIDLIDRSSVTSGLIEPANSANCVMAVAANGGEDLFVSAQARLRELNQVRPMQVWLSDRDPSFYRSVFLSVGVGPRMSL